jgi:hypothetical protein
MFDKTERRVPKAMIGRRSSQEEAKRLLARFNRFQSSSFAASLNPRRARPPAMIRAIQLTDLGTDQSPIMSGQSAKILTRWNNATKVKIIPATIANVLWVMGRSTGKASFKARGVSVSPLHGVGGKSTREHRPAAKPTIRAITISMARGCARSSE